MYDDWYYILYIFNDKITTSVDNGKYVNFYYFVTQKRTSK